MKCFSFFLIVSFLVFFSCSSEKEYPVKITEENGIKTVNNPDYPKEGKYDLVMDELFTLGKEEDNSKYILSQPDNIDIDNKGNLYVFDHGDIKFLVFDNNGDYVRSFGRKGQGPGDFQQFIYFKISPDNKLTINDIFNKRITWLDLDGKYFNSQLYKISLNNLFLDSKGDIYSIQNNYDANKLTSVDQFIDQIHDIVKLNTSSNTWTSLGSFKGEKFKMRLIGSSTMGSGPYNEFVWSISPDNLLFIGFGDTYELSVYDLEGKLKYKFNRNYSRARNPEFGKNRREPEFLSPLTRFSLFDGEGNFWCAQDFGGIPEHYVYDVFSKDGVFLKKVFSKYQIKLFKGSKAYSLINSKTEPTYIKAFKYSLKKREK